MYTSSIPSGGGGAAVDPVRIQSTLTPVAAAIAARSSAVNRRVPCSDFDN